VTLPARLRELPGKLGWMKWEPPSGCPVRGGGHMKHTLGSPLMAVGSERGVEGRRADPRSG